MAFIAFGVLASLAVLAFSAYMVGRYSHPQTHYVANVTVFFGWFLTFASVSFFLPIDVAASSSSSAFHQMVKAWDFVYWTSFLLTWVVVPLMQGFYEAGEFSAKDKFLASIKLNLKFYAAVGILFVGFIIYIAVRNRMGGDEILGFVVCLSNAWGLTLSVLLLGYGIVELPRLYWYSSNPLYRLKKAQYEAVDAYQELQEAKEAMDECMRLVRDLSQRITPHDPIRQLFDIVREKCPEPEDLEIRRVHSSGGTDPERSTLATSLLSKEELMEKDMAALHYHVKQAVRGLEVARFRWAELFERVEELEELIAAERSESVIVMPHGILQTLVWHYRVRWSRHIYRATACLFICLSVILVWCELTMFSPKNISPFAHLLHAVSGDDAAAVFFSMVILLYLSVCAFFSMFQLRLFRYYHMQPNRRTEENSMLFNASYLMRLMPPLGYNFLLVTRVKGTAFKAVIGRMDVVPVLGSSFNTYFPILISVFCLATLCNVYGRILRVIGVTRFEHQSEENEDTISEGKMLLRKEKRRRAVKPRDELLL